MIKYIRALALLCLFLVSACDAVFKPKKETSSQPPPPPASASTNTSTSDDSADRSPKDVNSGSHSVAVEAPAIINSKELSDNLKIRVEPSEKPERYMVYLSWPKIEDGALIRIRLNETLATVNPNQTDFNHEVGHDQTLTYTIETLDSAARAMTSFAKQIKIPRDFVVRQGQSEFTDDLRLSVNRIFLTSNVPLRTYGHRVELIAKELKSETGIIESFPEGAKAENDQPGASAGELTLTVASASGTLKVYMRGQNGGDGSKGPPVGGQGPAGARAGDGRYECIEINPGPGGGGGGGGNNVRTPQFKPKRTSCGCASVGGRAGDGGPGSGGNKGNPAQRGGDGGKLKVSIQDGREFDLQPYTIIGQPGSPGAGGDGQPGGAGGYGTPSPIAPACTGEPGNPGPQGPPGPQGDSANVGAGGQICIYIASETKNVCY